ncbi:J domain-containing protein [Herbaspirillum sp. HC18]|nr:J domain-containing protein [Herbaspirillum sp. HC18]
MARIHTHYDNLKVARDAPPEVIRAAYKTLSQKYHPDRNGNSAEAVRVFQILNSAYAVLSDPAKRREHDEWIARSETRTDSAPGSEFRECRVEPRPTRRSSRRHHRRTRNIAYYMDHYEAVLQKSVHRLLAMLEHFSRKLFRKT